MREAGKRWTAGAGGVRGRLEGMGQEEWKAGREAAPEDMAYNEDVLFDA